MSKLLGVSAVVLVTAWASMARAENVSAKKIFIKGNSDVSKRQVLVQSADPAIKFSDAVDPAANGASLHLYSATEDFCVTLPAGSGWVNKKNKLWKFKDAATKNAAQLKNGKLLITIKSGVTFTLDEGSQGTVDAQAQFGTGTRFCMRCTGKKDDAKKFLGKNCVATACDPERSACGSTGGTTTTTSGGSTTTLGGTTTTIPGGSALQGALAPPTKGRFNYNSMIGIPAVTDACTTQFPGTHPCSFQELQSAQAAGGLVGLKDHAGTTVTSFWAIDASAPALEQCEDDAAGGSGLNWEYGTAHTPSRGRRAALDNATGTLSAPTVEQCAILGTASWVGCCQ